MAMSCILTSVCCILLLVFPVTGYTEDDDDAWDTWLEWTACSVTCGSGFHIRSRVCDFDVMDNDTMVDNCTGQAYEVEPCTVVNCPVDGSWGNWDSWLPCTLTCGQGLRFRNRKCDSPAPAYNGLDCSGSNQDFESCKLRECPADGGWAQWTKWSSCSSSCENGTRSRQRQCSNPSPQYGGQDCVGDTKQVTTCFVSVLCPIDGNWAAWNTWTVCDKTCGTGYQARMRECSNPKPMYKGAYCFGNPVDTKTCNTNPCPIDGGWTDWLPWNSCFGTGSCTGTQHRLRLCTNPKPEHGGLYCHGDYEKTKSCSLDPVITNCTLDGGWSDWGPWSECHATCGAGLSGRTRTCTNPIPSGGGKQCTGSDVDTKQCSAAEFCAVDGGWTSWMDWFQCSASCGGGLLQRVRTCTNPKPQGGGRYCDGPNIEDVPCNNTPCSAKGGPPEKKYDTYRSWSGCADCAGKKVFAFVRYS